MITDQQGVMLTEIQFGRVIFHDAGDDMRVWRSAGSEAVFEQDTQDTTLALVSDGLVVLPTGDADCTVKVTLAGVAALEVWRREVRSRHLEQQHD